MVYPGLRALISGILAEADPDAIYMDPERGPVKMTERKSTNPKDILAQGEQRVLLHLIPTPALIETAKAMMDGARKYGPYNWREEGVGASTYISASMRHLRAYLDGEQLAADSRVHHLGHAIACLAILLDAEAVGNLVDDRPLPAPSASLMDALKRKAASTPVSSTDSFREVTRQNASLMQAAPVHTGEHRPEKYMGGYHSTALGVPPQRSRDGFFEKRRIRAEEIAEEEAEFSENPFLDELGIGAIGDDLDAPQNSDPIPPEEHNPGGCC